MVWAKDLGGNWKKQKAIEEHEEDIHDFIDSLIAESRKNDELIDWETAKSNLKATGKLWAIK